MTRLLSGGSFSIPRGVAVTLTFSAHASSVGQIRVFIGELVSAQALGLRHAFRLLRLSSARAFETSLSVTRDAVAVVLVHPRVLGRELMALAAVCLYTVIGGDRFAAQNVDAGSNGFQVAGIATSSIPAEVVKVQTFGDRANKTLIDNSMSGETSVLAYKSTAVSLSVSVTQPRPALIRPVSIKRESLRVNRLVPHALNMPTMYTTRQEIRSN